MSNEAARKEVLEKIKNQVMPSQLIGQRVRLKKSGNIGEYKGLCPFHQESSASFHVYDKTLRPHYHCYGCGANGDVIAWVMETERVSFDQALSELAATIGIEFIADKALAQKSAEERRYQDRLLEVLDVTAKFYYKQLTETIEGLEVIKYLEDRGIRPGTFEKFQIGYAPEKVFSTRDYLLKAGFSSQEIVDAGICYQHEKTGVLYERSRKRVMLPITNRQGKIVSFTGRVIEGYKYPEGTVKYKNGPASPVYDKSSTLFGLNLAKEGIRKQGEVVIVEGCFDVVTAHQFGFNNTVATLGTAATEEHFKLLSKYFTSRLVLALDNDRAGEAATIKAIETVRKSSFHKHIDLNIIKLPVGSAVKDPDLIIRKDPNEWGACVAAARPVIEHYIFQVVIGKGVNTAAEKQQAVDTIIPLLLEVGNPIQVEHYLSLLAYLTKIGDVNIIRQQYKNALFKSRPGWSYGQTFDSPLTEKLGKRSSKDNIEDRILAEMLRYSNRGFFGIGGITSADFNKPENRIIFEKAKEAAGSEVELDLAEVFEEDHSICEQLDFLQEMVQEEPELETDDQIESALKFRIKELKRSRLETELHEIYQSIQFIDPETPDFLERLEFCEAVSKKIASFS
jgi:DNA primase